MDASPIPLSFLSAALFLVGAAFLIGYPFSRIFDPSIRHRCLLAPPIGLALLAAISLPIFMFIPFTPAMVALVGGLIIMGMWGIGGWIKSPITSSHSPRLGWSWIIIAALISIIPAYVIAPHTLHGTYSLAGPIHDHAKAALIDEMVRTGIPPRNPFYTQTGVSPELSYYYGWYFLAAQAALLTGNNGWTVDIVMTGVTAFFSLACLGWATLRISGRMTTAWWVLPLSMMSSLMPVVEKLFGPKASTLIVPEGGFESWIVQIFWVPQHVFAALLGGLGLMGFVRLMEQRTAYPMLALLTGILAGEACNSSAWVGLTGIAPVMGIVALVALKRGGWSLQLPKLGLVILGTLIVTAPVALQEAQRFHSSPVIGTWVFPVLSRGTSLMDQIINGYTFWTLLLILHYGILYLAAIIWSRAYLVRVPRPSLQNIAIGAACFIPLLVAQFFHSVISTNDLGWRCVLVSFPAMTIMTACILSQERFHKIIRPLILGLLPLGLISGAMFIHSLLPVDSNLNPEAKHFYTTDPMMWHAVQAVTPPDEAVANDPFYAQSLTPWPGNISWALLSNRDSCTPAPLYLRAFSPRTRLKDVKSFYALTQRVFDGAPRPEDFQTLRDTYRCRTLLVVPKDALWNLPTSTPAPVFKLVSEEKGQWRIYRAVPTAQPSKPLDSF